MSFRYIIACTFIGLVLSSCNPDGDELFYYDDEDSELKDLLKSKSPTLQLNYYMLPGPSDLSKIPQDPKNPLSHEKVDLGQLLFHETGLAISNKVETGFKTFSCASCHQVGAAFQAGVAQGLGEGGLGFGANGEMRHLNPDYPVDSVDIQAIRTPTILNGAYQKNMLWNGQFGATGLNIGTEESWTEYTPKAVNHLGYEGLETQAIAGMGVHRLNVTPEVLIELGYKEMFDSAFAEWPEEERYTTETAGLAIAAYERTVMTNQAPFQKWLRGSGFLSDDEMAGAKLFFGKAGCDNCHSGPALNNMSFHALGMADLNTHPSVLKPNENAIENKGRAGFTGDPTDEYKFKVPQLYNLRDIAFLGHGSSFNSVREVIEYKNNAVPENPNVDINKLSPHFTKLNLTEMEINQLTTFITQTLNDADIDRYVPDYLPSGNCFPNADDMSKQDLGCE